MPSNSQCHSVTLHRDTELANRLSLHICFGGYDVDTEISLQQEIVVMGTESEIGGKDSIKDSTAESQSGKGVALPCVL